MSETKTLEQYFSDWEGDTFGFGYGSGEEHILPALRTFFEAFKEDKRSYDYRDLEEACGPATAWLLINALCRVRCIEYGTSPRFAWLTKEGERVRDFVLSHSFDELGEICCNQPEDSIRCYPDACNCGPKGYQKGVVCPNPFWAGRVP